METLQVEQAEQLFNEAQAIIQDRRYRATEQGKARLREIDKILPQTSETWRAIFARKTAEIKEKDKKVIAKFREEQLKKLEVIGLAIGDRVEMYMPSMLLGPGTMYRGVVIAGKRGNVYVSSYGHRFSVFSNPWYLAS